MEQKLGVCIAPNASIHVDSNGHYGGVSLGKCKPGAVMSESGGVKSYCERLPENP